MPILQLLPLLPQLHCYKYLSIQIKTLYGFIQTNKDCAQIQNRGVNERSIFTKWHNTHCHCGLVRFSSSEKFTSTDGIRFAYDPYFTIYAQGESMSDLLNISHHTLVLENGTEIGHNVDRKTPPSIACSDVDNYVMVSQYHPISRIHAYFTREGYNTRRDSNSNHVLSARRFQYSLRLYCTFLPSTWRWRWSRWGSRRTAIHSSTIHQVSAETHWF